MLSTLLVASPCCVKRTERLGDRGRRGEKEGEGKTDSK